MNSPKKINYELRPAKFVERKMLLTSLINVCGFYKKKFQYIGFGGTAFTDFKLFHKELHINKMISIEGGEIEKERFEFNKPFSFIKLEFGSSNTILPSLDLEKESIIWLDYDSAMSIDVFEDIAILFRKLPIGSVYLFTCNRQLKDRNTGKEYEIESFKNEFGSIIPFDIKTKDFTGTENFKTIRKMLSSHINSFIEERNQEGENLKFHQLFNFLYQENGGAKMYTYGGIIEKNDFDISELNLSDFDFIKKDIEPYIINIPNLTIKEADFVNINFNNEEDIISSKIVDETELKKYKKTYKYLPNYFDVRV